MSSTVKSPLTGVPRHARTQAGNPRLVIRGLVREALGLAPAELEGLPRFPFLGATAVHATCNLPANGWSGIRLEDLLSLAGVQPGARYVRVSGGPYALPLELTRIGDVLLCDALDDEPLAVEQGGPWRLVVPGDRYYTSVKWVDTLVVSADEPDNSALRIVEARHRAYRGKS